MKGGILLFAACISTVSATTIYTDQAAWQTAVGSFSVEPFDAGGLQAFTNVTTTTGSIATATGVLSGSVWHDRLTVAGGETTTFAYVPGALFGAGATFDTSPGGEGQGLILTLNLTGGGTDVLPAIGPIDGTFFGFTSSTPFDSFTISAGTGGGFAETFEMDNLEFSAATPEPATYLLLGAGLAALSLLRRKRA